MSDSICSIRYPINENALVMQILDWLPIGYENVVVNLSTLLTKHLYLHLLKLELSYSFKNFAFRIEPMSQFHKFFYP